MLAGLALNAVIVLQRPEQAGRMDKTAARELLAGDERFLDRGARSGLIGVPEGVFQSPHAHFVEIKAVAVALLQRRNVQMAIGNLGEGIKYRFHRLSP